MLKNIIIIFAIILFLGAGFFLPRDFSSSQNKIFSIEKGEGSSGIAFNLEKENIIWWSYLFKTYVFLDGNAGNLKAGCYILSPSMNIMKITEILSSGRIAKAKITIPEGFTSSQIEEKLKNETRPGLVSLSDYEGYLFPDTYEMPYCMEQEKIVRIMTDNFNRKTAGLKITPEVVIMASLLEKELKTKEDKEIASGILWKRIRYGMPLQVDAAMWTYEHYGLPPKPIANPGLESLEAAIYLEESQFWYYLSTPDGKTIFSRTLEEHNIAKARSLK